MRHRLIGQPVRQPDQPRVQDSRAPGGDNQRTSSAPRSTVRDPAAIEYGDKIDDATNAPADRRSQGDRLAHATQPMQRPTANQPNLPGPKAPLSNVPARPASDVDTAPKTLDAKPVPTHSVGTRAD